MSSMPRDRRPASGFGSCSSSDRLRAALLERLESATSARFGAYAADPVGFVTTVLGQQPWGRQAEILRAVAAHPQTTVRSSHGVGKTWVAACCALWWVYSHRPSLVLTTAPTARQVEGLLWAEINRLWHGANASPLALPGRCLLTRLAASREQTAVGLSTHEPEKFAGWHCEHLLVIVDEASGLPDSLFEVIQGTLTAAHCRLLLIGNPTRTHGGFFESHRRPGWAKLKISALDTPNFEGLGVRGQGSERQGLEGRDQGSERQGSGARGQGSGKAPMPELTPDPRPLTPNPCLPCPWLVTPQWVADRKAEWGEDSDAYRVRVLGEFPRASADSLIELAWLEAAEERGSVAALQGSGVRGQGSASASAPFLTPDPQPLAPDLLTPDPQPLTPVVFGLDVARFGDCDTVLAIRRGETLAALESWHGADLMQTCGRVLAAARRERPARLVIDGVGLGAGVVDRLRELQREGELPGCEIVCFASGERASDPARWKSRRDEAYWALRERYRDGAIAHAPGVDSRLTGQLTALRYRFTSRGQVEIESKDELRRRGVPSPDHADATALAFAPLAAPPFLPVARVSTRPITWLLPPLGR